MDFYFLYPVNMVDASGNKRTVAEIEMEAELQMVDGEPDIAALYALELAPGGPRFEIDRGTEGFRLAIQYLAANPQEQDRLAEKWADYVTENYPHRVPSRNEHATHWGGL